MDWDGVELTKATILSKIGGNLRIRSYVPLTGDGLKLASGENPNPLFKKNIVKKALVSPEISIPQEPVLYKVYEYDVMTQPGQTYTFKRTTLNNN